MAGLSHKTGEVLFGWAEVAQSLATILTTQVGERCRRRAFGIDGKVLLDRPQTPRDMVDAFIAIAEAIEPRFVNGRQYGEPRFDLVRVVPLRAGADGHVGFELQGLYYPNALLGDYSTFERADFSDVHLS